MNEENALRNSGVPDPAPSQWTSVRKKVAVIVGEGHRLRGTTNMDTWNNDTSDQEALKVLNMLKTSEFFQTLPEKSRNRLLMEAQQKKQGNILALDELEKKEKVEEFDQKEGNIEDQKQREKEDEENRLGCLWRQRSKKMNWTLLGLFHLIILVNFSICIFESYRIIVEHSKFEKQDLDGGYNCLHIINSGDAANHVVNIFHAFMCVAVLFADRSDTANILWALVFAQLIHAGNDTIQLFYNLRLPYGHQKSIVGTVASFVLFVVLQVLGVLVVIQRYYDMTNIVTKRTHRFTSAIYGGRLLNEQIIYQNESTFLQRKYSLRQATAQQIHGIVEKIHDYKKNGMEPDYEDINIDIKAAIAALKDVQSFDGPDLLKQLRKRNAIRRKEFSANNVANKSDNHVFFQHPNHPYENE